MYVIVGVLWPAPMNHLISCMPIAISALSPVPYVRGAPPREYSVPLRLPLTLTPLSHTNVTLPRNTRNPMLLFNSIKPF